MPDAWVNINGKRERPAPRNWLHCDILATVPASERLPDLVNLQGGAYRPMSAGILER
jgi:hypothetical protein